MIRKKTVCTAILVAIVVLTNLIPARIVSLRPFKLQTTTIAQEQDPMQMMMLIMMLMMMMMQMNKNNELQAEQRERASDSTEELLKELQGINNGS